MRKIFTGQHFSSIRCLCTLISANLNPITEQSQEDSLPPANQMEFEPEMVNGNGHHFVDHAKVHRNPLFQKVH
jgi:hypothetical protein